MTRTRRLARRWCAAVAMVCTALGCAGELDAPAIPQVDTTQMLPAVAEQLQAARARVERKPRDPEANGYYGLVLATYGRDEAADAAFVRARTLEPDHAPFALYHSHVLRRLGRTQDALDAIDVVLARTPDQVHALTMRARLHFEQARYDQARADIDRALELEPDYAMAQYYAGRLLAQDGQWEAATRRFERMLGQGIAANEVHTHLATAYRMLGRSDDAAHHLAKAGGGSNIKIDGYDPVTRELNKLNVGDQPHVVRAAEFFYRGEIDRAIDELKIANEKNPKNVGTHVHLVRFYGQKGQLDKALEHYEQAYALDPKFSQLHSNLGYAYQVAKRHEEAVAAYREALALNPHRASLHTELGYALLQSGDPDGAIEHFQKSLELEPDNRDLRFVTGETMLRMRRYPEAIAMFDTALAPRDQKTAGVYRGLARAHAASGNRAAAVEALEGAHGVATEYGNDALAAALDEELARLRGDRAP